LQRAKRSGVAQKHRSQAGTIIIQFIGETILMSADQHSSSRLSSMFLLPWLNDFTNKHISIALFADPL
jgi:hypothetical protein